MSQKIGILLINLGTPEAPTAGAVRPYLKQFLMDPYVVDIPYIFRWLLVNVIILPRRPHTSAEAYKKIWTDAGSPLLKYTQDLGRGVQKELGEQYVVEIGMRYGNPSIASAVEKLKGKVSRIIALPLYPQYSLAATESCISEFKKVAKKLVPDIPTKIVDPFYLSEHFTNAFVHAVGEELHTYKPEHIIFSFHGVPERHVRKTDPTGAHCLASKNCCDKITEANKNCYRAQSFATARNIATQLKLDPSQYTVSFQSRLGRTPWIKPYTDFLYKELAYRGIKRVLVVSPSFVADCLETLEEIEIRGRADFKTFGGEELKLVMSLNARPQWVGAVSKLVEENLKF